MSVDQSEPPQAQVEAAQLALLRTLHARDYRFVTVTPATHARVVARPDRQRARSLEDVLGWSLPFAPGLLDDALMTVLAAADAIEWRDGLLRSRLRVSSVHGRLLLHSSYPTDDQDAVFFGPDSYRFADLIAAELTDCGASPPAHVVDIGTGSGVGAVVAAGLCPAARVTMTDVNPRALRLARVNARAAGFHPDAVLGADLDGVTGAIDIALANPPYIIDAGDRLYRHGGGALGGEVGLDMARMATARLAPGGRMILYTGSAIVNGDDALHRELRALATDTGCALRYRELDPDIFGEELETPPYCEVDRIALVAAILTRPAAR